MHLKAWSVTVRTLPLFQGLGSYYHVNSWRGSSLNSPQPWMSRGKKCSASRLKWARQVWNQQRTSPGKKAEKTKNYLDHLPMTTIGQLFHLHEEIWVIGLFALISVPFTFPSLLCMVHNFISWAPLPTYCQVGSANGKTLVEDWGVGRMKKSEYYSWSCLIPAGVSTRDSSNGSRERPFHYSPILTA